MKGNKISEKALDQVAGGVIKGGDSSISVDGDNIVAVKGNETQVMSVDIFKELLADAGVSNKNTSQFMSMIKSNTDYSFDQVKAETGIDLSKDI